MNDGHAVDRRAVLSAAGASGVLVACGAALSACGGGSSRGDPASSSASGTATVPVAKVPVGGGVIVADGGGVVVVQPTKGAFKAFSSACPHQGCTVQTIDAGKITCPCHGSQFSVADGAVVHGPALRGLTALTARLEGSNIVVS